MPHNRMDYQVILDFVDAGSKILDLGCGDGSLLSMLSNAKGCSGTGIELDETQVSKCIANGISVTHDDIDNGLKDYSNKRFDYVIMNESLQQIMNPKNVILDCFRVGKKVIIGIPNFCHISARLSVFIHGNAPVTKDLPDAWYETPNVRFLSIKDFRTFCRDNGITILEEVGIANNKKVSFRTNLFASLGLFLLEK